jgi:hypothetical protein
LGEVVDFRTYKESGGKEILLLTLPCERPFHHEEYVRDLECRRCNVAVELQMHPSFDKEKWYG